MHGHVNVKFIGRSLSHVIHMKLQHRINTGSTYNRSVVQLQTSLPFC